MPVAIPCPHCDQTLRLPDHLYDRPAQCPLCSGAFHVRWRKLRHSPQASLAAEPERFPCRFCGQPIRAEALKCPFCRRWLNTES
jgi:hypothetical protein